MQASIAIASWAVESLSLGSRAPDQPPANRPPAIAPMQTPVPGSERSRPDGAPTEHDPVAQVRHRRKPPNESRLDSSGWENRITQDRSLSFSNLPSYTDAGCLFPKALRSPARICLSRRSAV